MPKSSHASSIAILLPLTIALTGCASRSLSTPPPLTSATKHLDPGHVYRLDFVVSAANAPGANATPGDGTFTMNLEERHHGEITTGTNVALSSGGGSRVDVGMKVKAEYDIVGDDLLLESSAELSSAESGQPGQPLAIHKVVAHGEALVTPGRPTLVASADDQEGHSSYRLMVTATKLR